MKRKPASVAVHGGEAQPHPLRSVSVPIFQTSTFEFESFAELRRFVRGEHQTYFYSRFANPTSDVAASKIAELEGGEAGLVAASGSAACFTVLATLLRPGDEILASETLYGGTLKLFQLLQQFGITIQYLDPAHCEAYDHLVTERTRLFWFETPTNPVNKLVDITQVVALAQRHRLLTVIDNTFATPINQRPLEYGVDIVVHSATKYLGGHSDLTAGAIVSRRDLIAEMGLTLRTIGGTLDAQIAYLLVRGMKTLDVRMQRINANAQMVAEHFSRHPQVARVHYPGLETFPGHALARQQMSGYGGIVALDLHGGESAAERLFDRLKLIKLATSFGGVETLITYPLFTSHVNCSEAELAAAGVSAGTVRLAIGLESAEDVIGDLEQALGQ